MWQRLRRLFARRAAQDVLSPPDRAPIHPMPQLAYPSPGESTTQEPRPSLSAPSTAAREANVAPQSSNVLPQATTPSPHPLGTPQPTVPEWEPATPLPETSDSLEEDATHIAHAHAHLDDEEDLDEEDSDDEWSDDEEYPAKRANAEADRASFGEELWGVSTAHRGAVLDTGKVARFALPVLGSERELADWLGIPLSRLRWYTHDRAADTTWHYVRYLAPKRSGGERVILAPKRELKALQRKVLEGMLVRVPTASSTHGFVRGRSIVTNARQHMGRGVVLKLDLKDFFPTITFPRVRGQFIALGYSFAVASAIGLLCTEYEREEFEREGTRYFISIGPRHLVQGAPTSPALANLVAWRLDRRLAGLAAKHAFTYTRYADDLTFSGDALEELDVLRVRAQRIIRDERFAVNASKTRIARRSARQIVTGLVANDGLATPRELRRRLRATLHNAEHSGLAAQNRDGRRNFAAYLQGQIAFVHAANPRHAAPLRASLSRTMERDPGADSGSGSPPVG